MRDEWLPLGHLRKGAIFETKQGIRAVKSAYRGDSGDQCILLESGEYAHFPGRDRELVREIRPPDQDARNEAIEEIQQEVRACLADLVEFLEKQPVSLLPPAGGHALGGLQMGAPQVIQETVSEETGTITGHAMVSPHGSTWQFLPPGRRLPAILNRLMELLGLSPAERVFVTETARAVLHGEHGEAFSILLVFADWLEDHFMDTAAGHIRRVVPNNGDILVLSVPGYPPSASPSWASWLQEAHEKIMVPLCAHLARHEREVFAVSLPETGVLADVPESYMRHFGFLKIAEVRIILQKIIDELRCGADLEATRIASEAIKDFDNSGA